MTVLYIFISVAIILIAQLFGDFEKTIPGGSSVTRATSFILTWMGVGTLIGLFIKNTLNYDIIHGIRLCKRHMP